VIGVLKIAAMPAAVPTGIMPRIIRRGSRVQRAMAMARPLATTTVGPSGPSGAPAPREIGVRTSVAATLRPSRMPGSSSYARRTRARFAPPALGTKRRMTNAISAETTVGTPRTSAMRSTPCCASAGPMSSSRIQSTSA
jgi:hypothetical protein